jgi:hypothetical protein
MYRPNNLIELYVGWDSDGRIPDIGFVFKGTNYNCWGLGPLREEPNSWMWPAIKLFQEHDGTNWASVFRQAMLLMMSAPPEYQMTGDEIAAIMAKRSGPTNADPVQINVEEIAVRTVK